MIARHIRNTVIRSIIHWWTGEHPTSQNRLLIVCPEYAAIERRINRARAKRRRYMVYQKQKEALVTNLLKGGRQSQ